MLFWLIKTELGVYNILKNAYIPWMLYQWPKAHCCEFCIEFWPELFYANTRSLGAIGLSNLKSADLRLHQ